MKWTAFLSLLGHSSLFEASMLLAGPDSPGEVRRQLSRWTASGRLLQIRRGLYAIAPPFARNPPHALALAARIRKPSYVSLQSALSFHGAIPESVSVVTSITTGRPGRFDTPLGRFLYRHVSRRLFWGYREEDLGGGEGATVALPEKALLDLIHLTPGAASPAFIRELRLAPRTLDLRRMRRFAMRAGTPKLIRAAILTVRILDEEEAGAKRL